MQCTKCRCKDLTAEDFYWANAKHTRRQTRCKCCMKDSAKRHYRKNCERYKTMAKQRGQKRKEFLRAYIKQIKMEQPHCPDCGGAFPWFVYDFDHVRGKKRFDISVAHKAAWSIRDLQYELAKCELVCANCHRIRTESQR